MRSSEPDYVGVNRASWAAINAQYTDGAARHKWAEPTIKWGVWGLPESDLGILPDVSGKDVIELGCGTAYFGARLKRAGARRVVGVDVTAAQLETARRCEGEFKLGLEFIEANAEDVPLPDAAFDVAVSEYGASIWCDPARWLPEAARLLRPSGELVFMRNSTLSVLCSPDEGDVGETLVRSQRDIARIDWGESDPGIGFHSPTGELIRLLRRSGFDVVDMIEVYAPDDATKHPFYGYVPVEWGRRWPAEEIWRVRLGP